MLTVVGMLPTVARLSIDLEAGSGWNLIGRMVVAFEVDFELCRAELLDSHGCNGLATYRNWRVRPGYEDVVAFVEGFHHRFLYEIEPDQIEEMKRRSEHALGDVRKEEQLPEVEDFTCPFAFQHIFHRYLEENRAVPTWQEFYEWFKTAARPMYLGPLLTALEWKAADEQYRNQIRRAVRWRIGKFFYSTIRELEVLVALNKRHDIPVRYHLLADVLFRTDLWLGNKLICLYFPNPRYRTFQGGRKPPASKFFNAPFQIFDVEISRQGYGTFWNVDDASIAAVAAILSE